MLFSKLWLSLLPVLAISASGNPVARTDCYAELNCGENTTGERSLPVRVVDERKLTNAERMQQGLPLNQPKLRGDRTMAARAGPSPAPTKQFYIRLDRSDNTGTLGWISKSEIGTGQFKYTSDLDDRLIVGITLPLGTTSGTTQLIGNTNSFSPRPNIALIQGRDDADSTIMSGSFQYLYFGISDATAPGAFPATIGTSYNDGGGISREAESAIWNVDLVANSLTATWINPSGATPASIDVQFFTQSTALYAGGDPGAFVGRYPAPIIQVNYILVPV